jgi:putative tryptophan/tyrosine transport system substrate-binding protein
MNQKNFAFALGALHLALCFSAEAQQSTKVPRIGFLVASTADAQLNRTDSFRRGLRELGYVEGQNIIIEYRYAEDDPGRLAELAAELVRLKLDVHRHAKQYCSACCLERYEDNPDRHGRWC